MKLLKLYIKVFDQSATIALSETTFAHSQKLVNRFISSIEVEAINNTESPVSSSIELVSRFLEYCHTITSSQIIKEIFNAIEIEYLDGKDIHEVLRNLGLSEHKYRAVLRSYFSVWDTVQPQRTSRSPALLSDPNVNLLAIFGGNPGTSSVIEKARTVFDTYRPVVEPFVRQMSGFLDAESKDEEFSGLYTHGLDIYQWLVDPDLTPDTEYTTKVSVLNPIVILTHLMQFMLTYKTLRIAPNELAQSFKAVTGHSIGMITAVVLSAVTDEESFYSLSKKALGMIITIGAYPAMHYPTSNRNTTLTNSKDKSTPMPMVSISNLSRESLEGFITEFNSNRTEDSDKVYFSLINAPKQYIVSGTIKTLEVFIQRLKSHCTDPDTDQSSILYSKRKPKALIQYVKIDAPFHSVLLQNATRLQYQYTEKKGWVFDSNDLKVPLRNCHNGQILRNGVDLNAELVKSICVSQVDWPTAISHPGVSHVIDFSIGGEHGICKFTHKNLEGRGIHIISTDTLIPRNSYPLGPKSDIYTADISTVTRAINWERDFGPKLVRRKHDQRLFIDTPMTRILNKPSVMVSGMTPTTSNEIFVSEITHAGYHTELAGGGIYTKRDLEKTINRLVERLRPGHGITLNSIYINPKLWSVQYTAIQHMHRHGILFEGLCIGGGVPSREVAKEIIDTLRELGLRHVSFKPSSVESILDVLRISRDSQDFPVILQWTGGRGGGHHSLEDFHEPLIETYAAIRKHKNVALVVGSGFGDADGTLPYMTGSWSVDFGYPPMPVDGILLGSRVMVAKESQAHDDVKKLIVETPGISDSEWESTRDGAMGGVITIKSEYGEPIHVIANRAAMVIKELDNMLFFKPREEQLEILKRKKQYVIKRLNEDYHRPWFGKRLDGSVADVDEMTYEEVARRLIELMYVENRGEWGHLSWRNIVCDFLCCIERRFSVGDYMSEFLSPNVISNPHESLEIILNSFTQCKKQILASEDVQRFMNMCKRRNQKPVPFIPLIDKDFEVWVKKDTTWQTEYLDATANKDAECVNISHGPVAAKYSTKINEPVKEILDEIYHSHITHIFNTYYNGDMSLVPEVSYLEFSEPEVQNPRHVKVDVLSKTQTVYTLSNDQSEMPSHSTWFNFLSGEEATWLKAMLTLPVIIREKSHAPNPLKRLFEPQPGQQTSVTYANGIPISLEITNDSGLREVHAHIDPDNTIYIDVFYHIDGSVHVLALQYEFHPETPTASIHEVVKGRNKRIKEFYSNVWFGCSLESLSHSKTIDSSGPKFTHSFVIPSRDEIQKFCSTTNDIIDHESSTRLSVPLSYISSKCLPLMCKGVLLSDTIDENTLELVHLSTTLEAASNHIALSPNDTLDCSARITEIANTETGKRVTINGEIFSRAELIYNVTFSVFYSGLFSGYSTSFNYVTESPIQVHLKNEVDVCVLLSKEWFIIESHVLNPGDVLEFNLKSKYKPYTAEIYEHVSTTGTVLRHNRGTTECIARVDQELCMTHQNPALNYLHRHGTRIDEPTRLENGGYSLIEPTQIIVPDSNEPYSRVSKDYNPIHTNLRIARLAGLPSTITHGMWTSSAVHSIVTKHAAYGDPDLIRSYTTEFVDIVRSNDTLDVKIMHTAMRSGLKLIQFSAHNQNMQTVLKGTAQVAQPNTAYLFTGQGSQEVRMGMDLYTKSSAAKEVWDRADKYMNRKYGISLLEIVRVNPDKITVHFGGPSGENIRERYMSLMRTDETNCIVPMFPEIAPNSWSFTFCHATGLLNSTQFTQPALMICELALIADMRSKSLIQNDASFAGHSLGEFSALAALCDVFTIEDIVDIGFYRGLLMKSVVSHDIAYRMVAINPSAISKSFSEDMLAKLISSINLNRHGLLEIANYNSEGKQYVVSGDTVLLAILINSLRSIYNMYKDLDPAIISKQLYEGIDAIVVSAMKEADQNAVLERTDFAVPLENISTPFHTSFLAQCVGSFRDFLLSKLEPHHIKFDKLINKYIPNLTAIPFSVDKSYFESVYEVTSSLVIRDALSKWNDNKEEMGCILIVELLAYQIANPVRWISTQHVLLDTHKVRRFIEIGPRPTLARMINDAINTNTRNFSSPLLNDPIALHCINDIEEVYYQHVAEEPLPDNTVEPTTDVKKEAHTIEPSPEPDVHTAKANINDVPLNAFDVVHALVSQKLRRSLAEIPHTKTIKDLVNGKSTLQNELLSDLQKEFVDLPDRPEELPLNELAHNIAFSGSLGKHSNALISHLTSTKLPSGTTHASLRSHIHDTYGLGRSSQDAILIMSLTMEPAARLETESSVHEWMTRIVTMYAEQHNITFTKNTTTTNTTQINSKELSEARKRLDELAQSNMNALAKYLDIDLRASGIMLDHVNSKTANIQDSLDTIIKELGEDFTAGIRPLFDAKMERSYDSVWNWARQDIFEIICDVSRGILDSCTVELDHRFIRTVNRSTQQLVDLIDQLLVMLRGDASIVASKLFDACQAQIGRPPRFTYLHEPCGPNVHVTEQGEMVYSEVARENERNMGEYIECMRAGVGDGVPYLFLNHCPKDNNQWRLQEQYTTAYFEVLYEMSKHGLTLSNTTALVTGCGRASIGEEVLKALLAAGARVIATTSSLSHTTAQYFKDIYERHAGKGSQLVIVPFNQASKQDVANLVDYVYNTLKWDLDYIVPFAAISNDGKDISDIDARTELSSRLMLTNIIRLLGCVARIKQHRRLVSQPTQVLLPLSPNRGNLGATGLYSESKIGLESLYTRWQSENWGSYLTITGAVIGWVRGTALMASNNIVAQGVELYGLHTFTACEMAFNIVALMHPQIRTINTYDALWADLTGGYYLLENAMQIIIDTRTELALRSATMQAVLTEVTRDMVAVSGERSLPIYQRELVAPRSKPRVTFPRRTAYADLAQFRSAQGMVNLDKVVVVTGFGEVGPYGHSDTRWEIEANGEFSIEGCTELAWIMGLIKHVNGTLESTGEQYTGWVDTKTGAPISDANIKSTYEPHILAHTGIRLLEPDMVYGYDPDRKQSLREILVDRDLPVFITNADDAAAFMLGGPHVDAWENEDGSWSVQFRKGASLFVQRAESFSRVVAGQLPSNWNPAHYGIPRDIIEQVDPITCQVLVAVSEALLRSGIVDPYELYEHMHVSEVGGSIGSCLGGGYSMKQMSVGRHLGKPVQSDILQETLINTVNAWVNMLLLSSSGPIKPTVGACGTSVLSIDVAADSIREGKAKVMIAGGFDDLEEQGIYEFGMLQATCDSRAELAHGRAPAEMSRPCTTSRSGFIESSGSGIVILMSAATALEIGAPIYGVIAASNTATDKEGRSVPAPGQGILTTAKQLASSIPPPLSDIKYRRTQLTIQLEHIASWVATEHMSLLHSPSQPTLRTIHAVHTHTMRLVKDAQDAWGLDFYKHDAYTSPLAGALSVWGLSVDDIGVASFHGTSTKANDINESRVFNTQLTHLGRTTPLPVVCQKWLTGHPKGAAATWMLNGILQSLNSQIIPGNRNADNIDGDLEHFTKLLYLSHSITAPSLKAGILKSFGFGQVGGELLALHPNYILGLLSNESLNSYYEKVEVRERDAYRKYNNAIIGVDPYVQVKDAPPYSSDIESDVYLNPLARAHRDPITGNRRFVKDDLERAESRLLERYVDCGALHVLNCINVQDNSRSTEMHVEIRAAYDLESYVECANRVLTPDERSFYMDHKSPRSMFSVLVCVKRAALKLLVSVLGTDIEGCDIVVQMKCSDDAGIQNMAVVCPCDSAKTAFETLSVDFMHVHTYATDSYVFAAAVLQNVQGQRQ